MTKDEVIALAEKCKLDVLIHSQWTHEIKEFTVVDYVVEGDLGSLMQFAKLVAEHEREACAKLCDNRVTAYQYATDVWAQEHIDEARHLAKAIRARGQA